MDQEFTPEQEEQLQDILKDLLILEINSSILRLYVDGTGDPKLFKYCQDLVHGYTTIVAKCLIFISPDLKEEITKLGLLN